jgi:hypothetical protein
VPVQVPETYYAHTVDGLSVAYQTVGERSPAYRALLVSALAERGSYGGSIFG